MHVIFLINIILIVETALAQLLDDQTQLIKAGCWQLSVWPLTQHSLRGPVSMLMLIPSDGGQGTAVPYSPCCCDHRMCQDRHSDVLTWRRPHVHVTHL